LAIPTFLMIPRSEARATCADPGFWPGAQTNPNPPRGGSASAGVVAGLGLAHAHAIGLQSFTGRLLEEDHFVAHPQAIKIRMGYASAVKVAAIPAILILA